MESWYYELSAIKNSPSSKDGINFELETRYRSEGSKFISTIGGQLKLRYITMATGTVYFHRFYMHHSFKEYHRYAIAAACLFLAGKVEETPKKARDLFKQIQASGLIAEAAMPSVFGEDLKESLMTLERILLKTIKFDLQVDHPYKFILKYAKTFLGDKAKIEKIVQMSWTFANDSLCTTLCLQWEPEIIAIALLDLGCRISKYSITDWNGKQDGYKGNWWDQFVSGVSVELLESLNHQVLDFYSQSSPAAASSTNTKPTESSSKTSDTSKRPATQDASAQPPAKAARIEQPVSTVAPAPPPGAPAVATQAAYPPPVTIPHTAYHPQAVYQQQAVSVAAPLHGYQAPPPGYPVYSAPPPHILPPVHAMPPGYPPNQQYYGQPPPGAAAGYYARPPPAVAYQHPQHNQYSQQAYQQDISKSQTQHRQRISSLKVINTNNQ